MDQTASYFESRLNLTVAKKGANNVTTEVNPIDTKSCTVVVAITADGTKLPLFFIFKVVPRKDVE
jgi:hypothetical protein